MYKIKKQAIKLKNHLVLHSKYKIQQSDNRLFKQNNYKRNRDDLILEEIRGSILRKMINNNIYTAIFIKLNKGSE